MNEMQIFENSEFGQVRTIMQEGEPWFVASDVCRVLGHTNPTVALQMLDDDERAKQSLGQVSANGVVQNRESNIISESGLYQLVIRSNVPGAKKFKRWITHEVIPTIRKHGMYATPDTIEQMLADPDTAIRLLTTLKEEREARRIAEAQNAKLLEQAEADAPKVLFADSVAASKQSILVGELAKLLRQNGADFGQNRLFEKLRSEGYLHRAGAQKNLPTQKAMDMGLFEIQERTVIEPNGASRLTRTPKVTGKGQVYFINRYLRA